MRALSKVKKKDLQNNYKIWNFMKADMKNILSRFTELQGSREGNSYRGNSTRSAWTQTDARSM